ncbi:hypothetical protein GAMM_40039 [Gammaproteobacteria bacterium]
MLPIKENQKLIEPAALDDKGMHKVVDAQENFGKKPDKVKVLTKSISSTERIKNILELHEKFEEVIHPKKPGLQSTEPPVKKDTTSVKTEPDQIVNEKIQPH